MNQQLQPWQNEIARVKTKFMKINDVNNFVNYDSEIMFATQLIQNSDYLEKIANSNPGSLRNAVINIASIGLSLNPATKYAYLVPRDGAACLDISYIGLIKLATDTGSIVWARAELVHKKDVFVYRGATEKPEFSSPEPFDRGDAVGVYCVAKTNDGDYLSGIMSMAEIIEIRARSKAAAKNSGPWITDFGEMAKKTIIKRESKTWPKTQKSERFDNAIKTINEHDGIDFEKEKSEHYKNTIINSIKQHKDTIDAVVRGINEDNYSAAAEAYFELTHDEMKSIWISPTRCKNLGIDAPFTTREREIIKTDLNKHHPANIN